MAQKINARGFRMTVFDEFMVVFEIPEVARPYIKKMVNADEMKLIVSMRGRKMKLDEVANRMEKKVDETFNLFLEMCYSRGIVDKIMQNKTMFYSSTNFNDFLPFYARFGNWDEIPKKRRKLIYEWHKKEFQKKRKIELEQLMKGKPTTELGSWTNHTVMPLNEVEKIVDAATDIALVPCDCRRLGQNCKKPTDTCIWMGENALRTLDRGYGKRLTNDEAKGIVRLADKKGLIHTAQHEWQTKGRYSVCNCCSCDCYVLTTARELKSKAFWPRVTHIANPRSEYCQLCGACVTRCQFKAFFHDGTKKRVNGKLKKIVKFDPKKCWGCGLCANTCPNQAILMMPLNKSKFRKLNKEVQSLG
jgi:ferredoxin